ncbi:hypothetical protein BQ8482_360108 [Mesorhizobium delmotii]|uniref:Uncharacterized protein n=1 Tax=Mesorhizobium delmotii TaxID=1631247 RepID=A0A2P9ARK1_9HYPH|nr:hypothetical protein BQ8482_360108 [Mesorhizobium delmotii]
MSGDLEFKDAVRLALGGNNCNLLAKEVAESISMRISANNPGTTFPSEYCSELKKLNP